jgi:DNA-binding LacI/PurR family transcriptional regulator
LFLQSIELQTFPGTLPGFLAAKAFSPDLLPTFMLLYSMDRAATIKDIARKLNISTSTVSRALRNQPDINIETRKAVLQMAEELDYQPNKVALSLLKKHTYTIGIVVPNMDYFFATAIKGIDEMALEAGYTVMVCQSNESFGREVVNTRRLFESRVDGFIISVSSETKVFDHFKRLQEKDVPIVFFDRDISDLASPKVLLDNFDGAVQATEHLIQQGCQRIAFLGGPRNLSISNTRKEGYLAALKKNSRRIDESLIVHCDFNQEYAHVATEELLKQKKKPDAIFAVSDRIAIGAFLAIKEKGLQMPNDIALVGFNNEPITRLLSPSISSVDQPAFEMGKIAAKTFIELINSNNTLAHETIMLKPNLIVRESSDKRK